MFVQEPNAREYLQLALARVLELQREIKEGTYTTDHTSDLGNTNLFHQFSIWFPERVSKPFVESQVRTRAYSKYQLYSFFIGESSSEEDLTKEVLRKVFEDLPGTPESVQTIIDKVAKPRNSQLDAIYGKRIQLLGYDTCRRAAVDFMKHAVRETGKDMPNHPGFRLGTYSRNEPRIAHRRTGLLRGGHKRETGSSYDQEIRDRMLRSLDLHLANKQRDYTAKLMRSAI